MGHLGGDMSYGWECPGAKRPSKVDPVMDEAWPCPREMPTLQPTEAHESASLGAMCYRFCRTVTNSVSRSRSTSVACQRALNSATWACQPFCSGESENLGVSVGGRGHLRGSLKMVGEAARTLRTPSPS